MAMGASAKEKAILGSGRSRNIAAMPTLRQRVLEPLLERDPDLKAARTRTLSADADAIGEHLVIDEPPGLPGRPERPALVQPSALKPRPVNTQEGRAALIHALAHIELNAIDLALDAVWRFPGLPAAYYIDWLRVAREEALHFELLRDHLRTLGHRYGDFPAHNGLWEMAHKTRHDVLARIALVPRTLEARGLDASPPIRAKLAAAGDDAAARILDVILRDEIGHVAVGNRWYRWLCSERGLDPVAVYATLAATHGAPRLRGPFNLDARRAAGFDDEELARLDAPASR
jgi:uncharacterized ferritin-like protein (DUF455 family)